MTDPLVERCTHEGIVQHIGLLPGSRRGGGPGAARLRGTALRCRASALGAVHPHLIALGFFGFLVATLFALRADFTGERLFRPFYLVYNVGIVLSAGALLAKGAALYTNTATQGAWTVYEAVGILGNVLVVVGLALLLVLLSKVVDHVMQRTPQA